MGTQMSTHNICLYKKVDKKYTGCNLKTTELLDCALIGVCAVIRSNTVVSYFSKKTYVVGTHYKCLSEVLLRSTHNLCFCGEISPRKHKLWVLIRNASVLLMSTHNLCFCGEIRKYLSG